MQFTTGYGIFKHLFTGHATILVSKKSTRIIIKIDVSQYSLGYFKKKDLSKATTIYRRFAGILDLPNHFIKV